MAAAVLIVPVSKCLAATTGTAELSPAPPSHHAGQLVSRKRTTKAKGADGSSIDPGAAVSLNPALKIKSTVRGKGADGGRVKPSSNNRKYRQGQGRRR